MNAEQFVANWKKEKESMLQIFFGEKDQSLVASKIEAMRLTNDQKNQLHSVLDTVLTDTMYTLLLGLDGATSIGNEQHTFKIYDEKGDLISDCGVIEAEAWKQFHDDV